MPLPGYDTPITIERTLSAVRDNLTGAIAYTYGPPITVQAAAAMVSFREAEIAAAAGEVLDAVVRVAHGTAVDVADRVTVPDDKGAPLAGSYRVTAVRWNPLDLRVLVTRTET